jgi:hypothetical protein
MDGGEGRLDEAARAGGRPSAFAEVVPGFTPENELERAVSGDPVLLEGLRWGKPRSGHPEGPVGTHVRDLLATIDDWREPEPRRSELRFLALLHDSLKYQVKDWLPRTGPNHHAARARRFAERYTDEDRLLATLELHDRPYSIWKRMRRTGRAHDEALDRMLERVPDPALFLRFVELDGSTEGKNREPIEWLRDELRRRKLI